MSDTFRLKPTWIQSTGLLPVRLPEPPLVQRTRGGQRMDLEARWDAAQSPAAFDALSRAGINLVFARFFAGFGIESEKLSMERAKEVVTRAHERGMKAALTVQLGSYVSETMLTEEPECGNWLQVNSEGQAISAGEVFRSRACFNSESYQRYMERVCTLAVETGADLICFDDTRYNSEPDSCQCPVCVAAFRENLRNQYGIQDDRTRQAGRERFGHNSFTHVRPPRARACDKAVLDAPIEQEWVRFKVKSLTQCTARLARMIGKRNPECAVAAGLENMLHSSSEAEAGISLQELAPYLDIVLPLAADPAEARKRASGEAGFLARTADALEMALIPEAQSENIERSIAENLAFNSSGLCCLDAEAVGLLNAEWETQAQSDLELQAVRDGLRFYAQHLGTIFLGAKTHHGTGGVALLRDGPSLINGGAGAQQFAQARQALNDAGIPFEIIFSYQIGKVDGVRCIVLPGSECLSDDAAKALDSFVLGGGGLVATDGAGKRDIWRRQRTEPILASLLGPEYPRSLRREAGIGRVAYVPHVTDAEGFVDAVRFALGGEPAWRVEADSGNPFARAVKTAGGIALHVVHAGEDPLRGLRCSIASERAPVSVTPLAPHRTYEAVPFSHDGARVSFSFDDVSRYVCFRLDY